jgi:hypothetical protein
VPKRTPKRLAYMTTDTSRIRLQRLVSLHTDVVRVLLQACMSHKHDGRKQHRLCTLVGGASLLYVTIQRSPPHIAAAACFVYCVLCTGLTGL